MYRRSDPRWNRTIQHITENIEHANESAQENLYGFTQRYVNPCLQSLTQCVNACTAPCMPAHSDRRRHRGRSRGRAESSFDFYDDWEVDESDGLLGWGSDNLDRFLGGASNYGATSQPGRLPAMNYAQRNRDPRYDTSRRKSTTAPRDSGQDPTIIPSSSYFGFLGRLPFKIGGKGLRYKPSAADLIEHPGAGHRSTEEEQPLIEDSDEDRQHQDEHKTHRRQRSNTHTSGHTTDSLSSRGDIFPSEDELEDAVPLDDEFTISLERRTTGQWLEDSASNGKTRSGRSKRPSGSRISSKTISSESPQSPDMTCNESVAPSISKSLSAAENPTLEDLQREEDILRVREEAEVQRRRREAHQIAVARGLAPEQRYAASIERPLSPASISHMTTGHRGTLPQIQSKHREMDGSAGIVPLPSSVSSRSITDVNELQTDRSLALAQNALEPQGPGNSALCRSNEADFIPARLPNFGSTHP